MLKVTYCSNYQTIRTQNSYITFFCIIKTIKVIKDAAEIIIQISDVHNFKVPIIFPLKRKNI